MTKKNKEGRIRGSFDKWWCIFEEFTHYKCIIEIGNIRVIRIGETEKEAFDKAVTAMHKNSFGDLCINHYLFEFINQFNISFTMQIYDN